jgi:Domain of unknown function (DUF4192)
MTTPTIRLGSPQELAGSVPSLLGFVPDPGSVVVVTIVGKRMGVVLRADLIPTGPSWDRRFTRQAEALASTMRRSQPDFTRAELIGWETAVGDVDELYADLAILEGIPLGECLTVQNREDGWQVLDSCPDNPHPQWQPLPEDQVRATAALLGLVVEDSRANLAARIAFTAGEQLSDAQRDLAGRLSEVVQRDQIMATLGVVDLEELLAMREQFAAISRAFHPGDLRRSGALVGVAVTSWLGGDGAMASIALEACPPGYSLANLLLAALAIPLPPQGLRTMLVALGSVL